MKEIYKVDVFIFEEDVWWFVLREAQTTYVFDYGI